MSDRRADEPQTPPPESEPDPATASSPSVASVTKGMAGGSGGFELAFIGVIFALAGLWIDRKLGTTPLFIIGMTVLGFVGSVLNVYFRYQRDVAEYDEQRQRKAH